MTDLPTSVCLSCLFISVCLFVSVCLSGVCRLSLCLSVCLSVSVCLFVSAGLRAGSTFPFWLKSLPVQSSPVLPVVHSPVQSKLRSSIIPFREAARPAVVWGQRYVLNLPFGGGAEPATISWLPKPGPGSRRLQKFEWSRASRAAPDTFPEDVIWFWKMPTTLLEDTYGSDTDPP